MNIPKTKIYAAVGILLAISFLFFCAGMSAFSKSRKAKEKIVYCEFGVPEAVAEEVKGKYDFLPTEISDYICLLGNQLDVDTDLAVSILLRENPQLITEAVHTNPNGTIDIGLWQLNDRYLWANFVPRYWKLESEFDPFNWKMNTFIALHLLSDLSESLKVKDDVIMAYNCGSAAVMQGNVPDTTISYLAAVNLNYKMLKNGAEQ